MKIVTMPITSIQGANYNPRKPLTPEDYMYKALKKNLQTFGLVVPLIYNQRTNTLVSGHQRLKVLQDLGHDTVDVNVIDMEPAKEKALVVALNKIQGDWDQDKLKDIIEAMDSYADVTGFSKEELQVICGDIQDLKDVTPVQDEVLSNKVCMVTLSFDKQYQQTIKQYIKDNGKEPLQQLIIDIIQQEGN